MPVHVLKKRTYLDAEGKATTDEGQAVSLLGIENDEITQEAAAAAGLIKHAEVVEEPAAAMLYYDAAGKKVKAGSPTVSTQYLDNDPNRPDAQKAAVAAPDKADDAAAAPDKADDAAAVPEAAPAPKVAAAPKQATAKKPAAKKAG